MGLTKLANIRCTADELQLWADAAKARRKSRTQWIRDVLNAAANGTEVPALAVAPPVEAIGATATAKELMEKATKLTKAAKEKTGPCDNRLPKGAFCKRCGRVHA